MGSLAGKTPHSFQIATRAHERVAFSNVSRRCPNCGTSFPDEVFFCGNDGTITIQEQTPGEEDARLGQQLGNYVVVARVADGAMGRVYEGRHTESKQRVAIKVLHADVATDEVAVERFRREYETAEQLRHPNVIKVIEFGTTPEGSHFMTMEYLEGEELGHRVRSTGAQPLPSIVRVICQAALALDFAHSFGVIHRDLKPDNIFLCRSPEGDIVRLLDFGSVKLQVEMGPKLTAFGTTLGSPYYMSPEQAMGKQDVDHRTDVFALAAILYEMLTGKIAFEGSSIAEILMKIVSGNPDPVTALKPGLPPSLDDVVEKGIRKEKERRWASAGALADALCTALGLDGDHKKWANAPTAVLEQAVVSATPAPPKPFGAPSLSPPPKQRPVPAPGLFGNKAGAAQPVAAPAVQAKAMPNVSPSEPPKLPRAGPPLGLILGVLGALAVGSAVLIYLIVH